MKNNIIASFLAITIFNVAFSNAAPTTTTAAQLRCAFEAACQKDTPELAFITDSTGDEPELPPGMVKLMGEPGQQPTNPEAVGKPVIPVPVQTANSQTKSTPPSPRKTLKKYPIIGAVAGAVVGGVLGALALQAVTGSLLAIVAGAALAALVLGGIGFVIGNLLAIDKIASDIFPE